MKNSKEQTFDYKVIDKVVLVPYSDFGGDADGQHNNPVKSQILNIKNHSKSFKTLH